VQPKIAKITRVCAYDRAGRGWSEPRIPTSGSYSQQTVEELRALLDNADMPGPYILVGHSIGGVYARQFIESYPNQVVGLVLLDASHPDQFNRIPTLNEERIANLRQSAIFPWLARLGLFRLFFDRGGELDFQDLPAQQHKELIALWSSPRYFESLLEEMATLPEILAQAQTLGNLGDMPLIVITAGEQAHSEWFELQDELASLSSNNLHITIPDASHASLVLNPQHAEQVSALIGQLVVAVRAGQPLASP